MENSDPGLEIRTYFVREKNALVARADFGSMYADLVLHEVDNGISHAQVYEELLRDALAIMTLHCAARPRSEHWAWTIHTQDPLANVFVTGDSATGSVVGTVYSEDVKNSGKNLLYAQCLEKNGEKDRLSIVEFHGNDLLKAAETFYTQSEQRQARLFRHGPEDIVMIVAQPDCDTEWLASLDEELVRRLDQDVTLSLLETRNYRFLCGCSQDRMMDVLLPVMRTNATGLFGEDATIRMRCPRCGKRHVITKENMEARVAERMKDEG